MYQPVEQDIELRNDTTSELVAQRKQWGCDSVTYPAQINNSMLLGERISHCISANDLHSPAVGIRRTAIRRTHVHTHNHTQKPAQHTKYLQREKFDELQTVINP